MRSMVGDFIEKHFNAWRGHKIRREKAVYLGRVIVLQAMSDFEGFDLAVYEKWPTAELEEAMVTPKNKWPTPGPARDLRHRIKVTMKEVNADTVNSDTILRWVAIWHLARVRPGKIRDALEMMASGEYPHDQVNDDSYLRKNIRPFDIATGRFAGCH